MRPLFCYITDRSQFAGDESARRRALLSKIADAARSGVDYIQLREKDLPGRELERLAIDALAAVRAHSRTAKLLINSRTDVALAAGADGVHLRGNDVSVSDTRRVWEQVRADRTLVGVSWHEPTDAAQERFAGADFAVFAPIFEKTGSAPAGLAALGDACRRTSIPVLALGGVTADNARACLEAGAAGIAGIRLFQEHDIASLVRRLRV